MSYDICFKVKIEGVEEYVEVGNCRANITCNLREMIQKSTGLEWKNVSNNGLCKDIIPCIAKGYNELLSDPKKYKQYEAPNGWGTIEGCKRFFSRILNDWEDFCTDYSTKKFADVAYFWIE